MEYTTLGDTGMTVSRICLGCMSFGMNEVDKHSWALGETESREVIDRAIELGINFFDTANAYSYGNSERVLGRALSEYDRDEQVVASKVFFEPTADAGPNASGLSRKTIDQELENSLERLGMDTIDLYQIHRWDPATPVEETLGALDDAVRRNKVRYTGASSMWAYQFADALHTSERRGLERFATMQNHYNLAYREEEREMLPLCDQEDIGVIPWSPFAHGYLARPHEKFLETNRAKDMENSWLADRIETYRKNGGETINERVEELAAEKDASMAQIALAWLLEQDTVDAPIVGTTSVKHLEDAVEALEIDLSDSEQEYLEEPYRPVEISGHE